MSFQAPYRLRQLNEEDRREMLELDVWAFPTEHSVDELMGVPSPLDWSRTFAVERSDQVSGFQGMFCAYPLKSFGVPGAQVECGFLSWVGVHPSHRRRGLLSNMIDAHFADDLAHGESVSALTASEPGIYGRFGYGAAAAEVSLRIERKAELREVAGAADLQLEFVPWSAAQHGDLIADLHLAYGRLPEGLGRPGWASWETPGLRAARDADLPMFRDGKEANRLLIVRDTAGAALGYAIFRRTFDEDRLGPNGVVHVREAVAHTPAAARRLWEALLDIDLTTAVEIAHLPVDDPILSLLLDTRRARANYRDNLWLRILDLQAALSERRYAADVDVVIDVTDTRLPANAGRWRVRAKAWGHAEVSRSDAEPDLRLDIRELGAAHLGSVSLAALAQAGLVSGSAQALAAASAAWGWPIAAGANWVF
ncbi:GNAT family N-acetyltransferase [Leucobacter sp. UT-8R-CII-1-4]|uniref:GNAT family N-acetyltransferase n=1 Tax=Leucobacter sp. UT-8R-CII-1-4 TaxID=3040075 RepID=UPI0024A8322F|nr:GNAT family N-acetyltransferase [Leucobacter sp. UT-8R-CII-1-4]MDI6022008.1 GNAT family N-acetyltransferase [Leucobacter sp. UT-8R-CII-1-4]